MADPFLGCVQISTLNIAGALTNLQFQYDLFDSEGTPKPQSQAYLAWLKGHLVRAEPVVWFVMCQGDRHDACGQEWDHIEPVWGFYSNASLSDPRVYGEDVLVHASDYAPDGALNLGYFRAFGTLTDSPAFEGNCSAAQPGFGKNEMYPCLAEDADYGVALLGPAAESARVSVRVDAWEEPDIRQGESPANLTATVTVAGLTPGQAYILYRWDVTVTRKQLNKRKKKKERGILGRGGNVV